MHARSPEPASAPLESAPLVSIDAGRTVVWLRGEHDISTVAALNEALGRAIDTDGVDVVVDLRRVTFMDASTMGAFVGAREAMRDQSRRFALRSPSARSMYLLAICGLTDLVEPAPFHLHERTSEHI